MSPMPRPATMSCQVCRVLQLCRPRQPFERSYVGRVVRVSGQAARQTCNQDKVPSGWRSCPLKWHCLGRVSRGSIQSRVSCVVSALLAGFCSIDSFMLWLPVSSSCRVWMRPPFLSHAMSNCGISVDECWATSAQIWPGAFFAVQRKGLPLPVRRGR